jgi:hypothetical protein
MFNLFDFLIEIIQTKIRNICSLQFRGGDFMKSGKYRFVWKAIKYHRKQGGEIINTPSFIIGL